MARMREVSEAMLFWIRFSNRIFGFWFEKEAYSADEHFWRLMDRLAAMFEESALG